MVKPISLAVVSAMDAVCLVDGACSKSRRRCRIDYRSVAAAVGDFVEPGRLLQLILASHTTTCSLGVRMFDALEGGAPLPLRPDGVVPATITALVPEGACSLEPVDAERLRHVAGASSALRAMEPGASSIAAAPGEVVSSRVSAAPSSTKQVGVRRWASSQSVRARPRNTARAPMGVAQGTMEPGASAAGPGEVVARRGGMAGVCERAAFALSPTLLGRPAGRCREFSQLGAGSWCARGAGLPAGGSREPGAIGEHACCRR